MIKVGTKGFFVLFLCGILGQPLFVFFGFRLYTVRMQKKKKVKLKQTKKLVFQGSGLSLAQKEFLKCGKEPCPPQRGFMGSLL